MAFDVVTYILSKKYADSIISMLPQGFIYKGSVSYQKDLPTTAEIGHVYTVVYTGESGTEPWGAEFVCDKVESGAAHWLQLGADYAKAIAELEARIANTYLPLTAGSTKALTDSLYINNTNASLHLQDGTTEKALLKGTSTGTILASNSGLVYLRTNSEDITANTNCSVKLSHNDAAVMPEVNNTTSLGTEAFKWKEVQAIAMYQDGNKVATEATVAAEATVRETADTLLQNNINTKQDILVSGTNIKTLNNESILGSGNIDVTTTIGRTFTTANTVGGIPAGTIIESTEKLSDLLYRILGSATPVHQYKAFYYEGTTKPSTISSEWTTTEITEEIKKTGLIYNVVGGIKGYLGIAFNKALSQAFSITQNDFTLNFLDAPSDFDCTEVTYEGETYIMYIAKEIAILENGDKYKVSWKA